MEKQTIQSIVKGLTLSTVFAVGTLFNATANNAVNGSDAAAKAEIKYAGSSKEQVSFNIKFNNPSGKKFTLLVFDAKGDLFFKEHYNAKNFDKRLVLSQDDADKLTFRIQQGEETFSEKINVFLSETESRKNSGK